jgi:penicillin-binding protein 1C
LSSSRALKRIAAATAAVIVVWAFLYAVVPKPHLKDGVGLSRAVYDSEGSLMRLTLSPDEKYRLWLGLDNLSPLLVKATLLQEDRYFRYHPGVNPVSLLRATWTTYVSGSRRMGGSTVTMQLARIRYGMNTSTVAGKLNQILKALQLELFYTKDEILEAYLNLAPYGLNVEGAAAASLVYFNRRPIDLGLHEALTLAVIPQDPNARTGFYGTDAELVEARLRLYGLWEDAYGPEPDTENILRYPPELRHPSSLPFAAPHFVYAALNHEPHEPELFTSLDPRAQRALERVITGYVTDNRNIGITNASALLVDFRDMSIRALVGSADFFDDGIQGQVDGTDAKRSPGSTVKPLVYALAIDQGRIHPMTMLKDAPTSFGPYSPSNYDHEFTGPVKVKDALVRSRNLPALQVAAMLDGDGFYGFLRDAGVSGLREKEHYGLGSALGGTELSMRELAECYAMLADGGVLRPLRMLSNEPVLDGRKMVIPEAAFMTLDMLESNPRPHQGYRSGWSASGLPVAWKTGTSFAYRDAWSVGVFGPYVLCVWVGNFDGRGDPAFVGREAAGPLFFGIVDAIRSSVPDVKPVHDRRLLDVKKVKVCSVSGGIPGGHCEILDETWFIPGISPIARCQVHKEITVDSATGLRIADGSSRRAVKEVYEFWPSDLLKVFADAGIPRRTPPPWDPSTPNAYGESSGRPPEITSPQAGVIYISRLSRGSVANVPLRAVTDADSRLVHWFADETYLGKSESGQSFIWGASPGEYVIRAVDEQGRSDVRELRVATTM